MSIPTATIDHPETEAAAVLPRMSEFIRNDAGVWQSPHAKPFNYSDGDATEERMYRIVAGASNTDVYSSELVSQINDWPSEYHFSPRRANVIRLLDLDASHRVLELGCGCGAITKALAETGCRVDAIEGSPRRARVAASRVRNHPNAAVYHSNFQDVALEPVYDLVTLIGVLEYSPVYLDAPDPFVACLQIALSALKPGGTLLVAIENRMGLKYFAGISEDHFNRPYYGIEGRYGKQQTTTYGRQGLERKLRAAGFGNVSFYFPFPDYKLPEALVSEQALDEDGFRPDDLLQGLDHRDYNHTGRAQFNLDMTLQSLHEEGLLGDMANSFLVLATRHDPSPLTRPELLAQKYSDARRPGLNCVTDFIKDRDGIAVIKQPINREVLALRGIEHVFTQERYQTGRSLSTLMRRAAVTGRTAELVELLNLWSDMLRAGADEQGMLPGEWMDVIPSNLILQKDGQCAHIDREWRLPGLIPVSTPLYRGLMMLTWDPALATVLPEGDPAAKVQWLCREAGWEYDADAYQTALDIDGLLWREVYDNGRWWRVDSYRFRPQVGALSRPLDYAEILARCSPTANQLLEVAQATRPITQLRIGYVVLAVDGNETALARTLQSIAGISPAAHAIHVLGNVPLPPAFEHVIAIEADAATALPRLNALLEQSDADWIQLVAAGDQLSPLFAHLLEDQLAHHPGLSAVYTDEDSSSNGSPAAPIFKPDLNLDLLRSYPYTGHSLAIRREHCVALGGFNEDPAGLGNHDLIFRLIERHGLESIGHIAEPLLNAGLPFVQWLASPSVTERSASVVSSHLDRLGIAHDVQSAGVPGINRVRYTHHQRPPVSIIIPTRDHMPLLNGLLDSLLAKTSYRNYELLIVDNDSRDPATCAYLDGIERLNNPQLRVLRWPHPFNYAAINNFAAAQARGEYLLLLNNDTAVLHDDWLEALLNHAQRPEVGIVGAKLHYPDGRIQHAGMVLGLRGAASHPFLGDAMDAPGYMHRLLVDQNYTAVTAACLMIRKSVYEQVGGLDETELKLSHSDVDLCLKVRAAGYLTVWTPYARLMHEDGASHRQLDKTQLADQMKRFEDDQRVMYRKWLPVLARDPAYNRNLSLEGNGYGLQQTRHLAWEPFEQALLPRFFCVAADEFGCGHYRIRQPFQAMQRQGLAEGSLALLHLNPVAMEQFAPTSIVLQRQITQNQLKFMRNYREFSSAFKVYELDDYLPKLPLKNHHKGEMPKDVLKSLRKALTLVDRFVVSTAPLAEQFVGMHDDIRVVHNRLPVHWWRDLSAVRRRGPKPRVGWGGGSSHRGDLEVVADVVRELAGEVDWVFFGLCPPKLRPYISEFHEGVAISQYPAKLASMDLDLAIAPLEDHVFNSCKSNLRLLEYGACGFPVVCSDIECYRGDLPVTRVRNRYKDWVDAIRMHLADMDACARMGDALRDAVRRDWMLEGEHLVNWRKAWLPD
ncbi:glycosyltransferase [Dyella sp. RRB7]|uniref:glycosyltransferase n=1 Tax=Dyella sp. RRB7 TaxID=2919502 RepID=UPI001FAA2A37|nr:glycosyltransferase [Dyella sp. RRB7]